MVYMAVEAVFSLIPSFNINTTCPDIDTTIPFNQENKYMYTKGYPPSPSVTARNLLQNMIRWSKYSLQVKTYFCTFEYNYNSNDDGTILFCESVILGYDAFCEAFRASTPDVDPNLSNEELQTLKEFRYSPLSIALRYKYVTLSGSLSGFRSDNRTCKTIRILNFPASDYSSNANPSDPELEMYIEPDERKKEPSRYFYIGFVELECVEKTLGFNALIDGILYKDIKKLTVSSHQEGTIDSLNIMTHIPIPQISQS